MDQHLERLQFLAPILRTPAEEFLNRTKSQLGIILLVVYTWRDWREQEAIYRMGRTFDSTTKTWNITDRTAVKTHAKPGTSAHNVITASDGRPAALALDVVPLSPKGEALWNTPDSVWANIYTIAAKCGLDPLGDTWGASLPMDKCHFEEPGWKLKLDALGVMLPTSTLTTPT